MSWNPDPDAFLADLERKPDALRSLARTVVEHEPWRSVDASEIARIVYLGMGSSRYAAVVAASRLRACRWDAVAEWASATAVHPGGPGTLAVGISASGSSHETVAALARHERAGSTTVALTNRPGSELTAHAALTVDLSAGIEEGGVACRTFQHTLAQLLALEAWITHREPEHVARWIESSADATVDLLDRRDGWLPRAHETLTATGRAFLLAPAERICNAEQGALMFREGPRLQADACETGDWTHVDVYLTKPLDYRALVFTGSDADSEAMRWLHEGGAAVVTVGPPGAGGSDPGVIAVRHVNDEIPEVSLLTEALVPELVAAEHWRS
ncbi:MAG: SIS domain-containing protein [Gaiella sp.]